MKKLALSIRQPWAHLIIHAAKDIENRRWPTRVRGDVLIHASKTMSRHDYQDAVEFCSCLPDFALPSNFEFPSYETLKSECGGIVGVMKIVDCVSESPSPWFCGPFGFVIDRAMSLPFNPCNGALGFFTVKDEGF